MLELWAAEEEKRIHVWIVEALRCLIHSQCVNSIDDELLISGKLRKFLYRVKKDMNLVWTLQPEGSSFEAVDAPRPIGHPDFIFSGNTPEYEQYDYHVECKLVRVKRKGKSLDYCEHYITNGVQRFQNRKYAQSQPPMGTMIGYVQEGCIILLLNSINDKNKEQGLDDIRLNDAIKNGDVTHLSQNLQRNTEGFVLYHLWADLR